MAVGEKAYAEGLGDDPSPRADAGPEGADQRAGGNRQAGDRRGDRGPAARHRPGQDADALLMAYQGSTEAGTAVADVHIRQDQPKRPPAGELAVGRRRARWGLQRRRPITAGRPAEVLRPAAGHELRPGHNYNPLYPFGFGLSYTTFKTSGLSATSSASRTGTVTATFTVSNTGGRAGTEIVPVYVHQPISAVVVRQPEAGGIRAGDPGSRASPRL